MKIGTAVHRARCGVIPNALGGRVRKLVIHRILVTFAQRKTLAANCFNKIK